MSSIYIFNGKDITMNVCIQIHDVINLLQEQENIDFFRSFSKILFGPTFGVKFINVHFFNLLLFPFLLLQENLL